MEPLAGPCIRQGGFRYFHFHWQIHFRKWNPYLICLKRMNHRFFFLTKRELWSSSSSMPLVYRLENWVKGLTPGHRVTHSRSQARASVSGLPIWYSLPSYFLLALDHELVSLMKRIPFDTTHWLPRVLQMWPSIEWNQQWPQGSILELLKRHGSEFQGWFWRSVKSHQEGDNRIWYQEWTLPFKTINNLEPPLGCFQSSWKMEFQVLQWQGQRMEKNEVWISEALTQGQSGRPLKAAKSRTGGKRTLVHFKD